MAYYLFVYNKFVILLKSFRLVKIASNI